MSGNIKQDQQAKDNQLILDYIYGELGPEQLDAFEQRVSTDRHFRALVSRQQQLDLLMPPGTSPNISQQRVTAVDWTLHKKLSYAANKGKSGSIVSKVFEHRVSVKVQLVGMALTFALGIMVAQSSLLFNIGTGTDVAAAQQALPLDLIGDDDYQIVDLELVSHGPLSTQVKLNYSLSSTTQLSGDIASKDILNLLALTMKNDVSDATRIEIVEIFREHTQTSLVRQALSHSLLNDPNPGVRMAAAESLTQLSDDKLVRQTLRQALEKDINSGIRVVAFEGLIKHLDDQATLKTLKHASLNDSNQYIRSQARLLVDDKIATNTKI